VNDALASVDVGRLRLAIVRLARLQRQHSGTGLTPSVQSALVAVELHGPVTIGALAEIESISAPSTTRIVNRLAELGLVLREPHPDDGRCTRVIITEIGRTRLAASRVRRDLAVRTALAELDEHDVLVLASAVEPLERLLARMPDIERRVARTAR
jgi:DNA-binding MarR family transcriptional regulator